MWLIINRASSPTVTRPSCRQCDSPTWSHTAFLSRFHARCRSPFWLQNRRSRLRGGTPVESLQSHMILTMSHWSSGLPVCFPSQGTQVQIPWGDLCETGILLLALSRYSMALLCLLRWFHCIYEVSVMGLHLLEQWAINTNTKGSTPQIRFVQIVYDWIDLGWDMWCWIFNILNSPFIF